jgi:hypothetical protein
MRLKFFTLLVFVCSSTFGQTYKSVITEADQFYKNKEYQKSVEKYREAFKFVEKAGNDFYSAAYSVSLFGDNVLAFE